MPANQGGRGRASDGTVPPPGDAATSFRSAVLSTVHSELRTINNRACNIVVTGLKPNQDKSDDDLFKDLCLTHLSIYIDHNKSCRIGKIKEDGSQPLLVSLKNAADASNLLGMAKQLRSSSDPDIRSHVFINKHLTPAEAKSAYEARVLRRSKAGEQTVVVGNSISNDLHSVSVTGDSSSMTSSSTDKGLSKN